MLFNLFVLLVAMVAAAIASVTGFGIGSLLTPTLAIDASCSRSGSPALAAG